MNSIFSSVEDMLNYQCYFYIRPKLLYKERFYRGKVPQPQEDLEPGWS
jgi:hypothetical protein